MFIFSRNKKVVVDAYTRHEDIRTSYPIETSAKFLPEWWVKAPSSITLDGYVPSPTLKTCSGLTDLYTKGLILPLWTDIAIKVESNKSYSWRCADETSSISVHAEHQWDMFADPTKYGHLKIACEWAVSTKENIDWVLMAPYWNTTLSEPYSIPPGIVNGFYKPVPLQTQLMLDISTPTSFMLTAGTPLVQIIPLTEKRIDLRRHVVSEEEFYKLTNYRKAKFIHRHKHNIKMQSETNKPKCPFTF